MSAWRPFTSSTKKRNSARASGLQPDVVAAEAAAAVTAAAEAAAAVTAAAEDARRTLWGARMASAGVQAIPAVAAAVEVAVAEVAEVAEVAAAAAVAWAYG